MKYFRRNPLKRFIKIVPGTILASLFMLSCEDYCDPVAIYGPPPCYSDQECIDEYGDNWYCDQDNTFPNGCGDTTTWPICRDSSDS